MRNEDEMGSIIIRDKNGSFIAQYFWGGDVNSVDRAMSDGSIYRRSLPSASHAREDAWLEIRGMQIYSIPHTAFAS